MSFRAQKLSRNLRKTRAYTVVELMMALTIFAIGATGVLALQIVAAGSNTHAKNIAVATQLARSWQEQLAMDALLWGSPVGVDDSIGWQLAGTEWLAQVGSQNNVWHLPVNNTAGNFGPAADAKGAFVDFAGPQENTVFCTHIRLTTVMATENLQLLRSEVRVFWPKGGVAWNNGADYCDAATATITGVGAATGNFHFVYQTSAIRQTPAF